jgi:hypothetical protein
LKNIWVGALRVVGGGQTIPSPSVARTDDRGQYRVQSLRPGQYVIIANTGHGPIGPEAKGVADSRTYFPSTLDIAAARHVSVGPAQVVSGLDFTLLTAPLFEVSGTVVDETGEVHPGEWIALDADYADWPLFGGRKATSRTGADGRFRFAGIAPGSYLLRVGRPGRENYRSGQTWLMAVEVIDANVTSMVVSVPRR